MSQTTNGSADSTRRSISCLNHSIDNESKKRILIIIAFPSSMAAYEKMPEVLKPQEAAMDKIRIMESSVRKWQRIIEGKSSDGGVLDCPPCRIYYLLICIGCPIAEYTGKKF